LIAFRDDREGFGMIVKVGVDLDAIFEGAIGLLGGITWTLTQLVVNPASFLTATT
jgi:hypothetical protein